MIKNKTAKAFIIGTCLVLGSSAGVYADQSPAVRPAIIEKVDEVSKDDRVETRIAPDKIAEEDQIMTIQILSINENDALTQKHQEISSYAFKTNKAQLIEKGIRVAGVQIVGDTVEIAIAPYDEKRADYLYEIFGKDMVTVVEMEQAVAEDLVTITSNKSAEAADRTERGFINALKQMLGSFVEWIKGIF